jgi:hypothetical protein
MIITLNEAEIKLANYLGTSRHNSCRKNNVIDKQRGDQDKLQIDIEGVGAEIAFCKLSNTYPDLEIKPTGQITDKGDALFNGIKADVKSTRYATGKLQCSLWKNNEPDIYVLMITTEYPTIRCAGFAWSEHLKTANNIKDLGRGELYLMDQKDLQPIEWLLQ